jgi:hypothetical protein
MSRISQMACHLKCQIWVNISNLYGNKFFCNLGYYNSVALWYVQNVSTSPNPFAVLFHLICVFWIQLTCTNTIFSRIALVSCFCAEIQLSGKFPENIAKLLFYQKTHRARRRDGEEPRGAHTTWWRELGQAAPGGGVAASVTALSPPFAYIRSQTWKQRVFGVFPR